MAYSPMRWMVSFYVWFGLASCVPPPEPPQGVVYADRGPPGPLVENVGVSPKEGVVWRNGFWRWNGNDFVWVPGEWVTAPSGSLGWVPGHWVKTRKGWFFVEGHWR
jgi:hypothetical protein